MIIYKIEETIFSLNNKIEEASKVNSQNEIKFINREREDFIFKRNEKNTNNLIIQIDKTFESATIELPPDKIKELKRFLDIF